MVSLGPSGGAPQNAQMTLRDDYRASFPNLGQDAYQVSSPATDEYNCFAWAAHVDDRWWQPSDDPRYYWPDNVPRTFTLESFVAVYEREGFEPCDTHLHESGYERVAIYLTSDGLPSHAARQLPNGRWTSKLGDWQDIEHDSLAALEGDLYGRVSSVMRRRITES